MKKDQNCAEETKERDAERMRRRDAELTGYRNKARNLINGVLCAQTHTQTRTRVQARPARRLSDSASQCSGRGEIRRLKGD